MGKPLWKFLEDGGIDACIEYGELPTIKENSNCCSWASGDYLHFHKRIARNNCLTGRYNNTNKPGSFSFKYMETRFTADLIANGAKFMGLGEEIPKAPDGYYISAAFYKDFGITPDFHFIRRHSDGTWTERPGREEPVKVINYNPKSIFDLLDSIDVRYRRIFKGWFAIPNNGIQNGIDRAIFQHLTILFENNRRIKNSFLNNVFIKDTEKLINFYKEKNNLMNNVTDLDNLEYNFKSLVENLFIGNKYLLEGFLQIFNKISLSEITNSPQRVIKEYVESNLLYYGY